MSFTPEMYPDNITLFENYGMEKPLIRAAYVYFIKEIKGVPHFLLYKVAGTERWGLPGGQAHTGENMRAAALREVNEETGLQAQVGFILNTPTVIPGQITENYVAISWEGEPTVQGENPEMIDPSWKSEEEARKMVEKGVLDEMVLLGFGLARRVRENYNRRKAA